MKFKVDAMSVTYIESGTFVGGEEDYYKKFVESEDGSDERPVRARKKEFVVLSKEMVELIESKFDVKFIL